MEVKMKEKLELIRIKLKLKKIESKFKGIQNRRFSIKVLGGREISGTRFYDISFTDSIKGYVQRIFLTKDDLLINNRAETFMHDFVQENF